MPDIHFKMRFSIVTLTCVALLLSTALSLPRPEPHTDVTAKNESVSVLPRLHYDYLPVMVLQLIGLSVNAIGYLTVQFPPANRTITTTTQRPALLR